MYTVEIFRHHIDTAATKYTNIISIKTKKDYMMLRGKMIKILVNLYETTEIIIRDQSIKEVTR